MKIFLLGCLCGFVFYAIITYIFILLGGGGKDE